MLSKMSFLNLFKSETLPGIIMIISFILALLISNIDEFTPSYFHFIFYPIRLHLGQTIYGTSVINLVNDGLMTFFFLMIGLELKYHLVLGEYAERKTLILPVAAAIGGVIAPALIYTYFNYNEPTLKGWAIPIASDTAFMLGIISFFTKHISLKLRAFIISFSLIDDALAMIVLALFYTDSLNLFALFISLIFLGLLLLLNYLKIKSSFYYLLIGSVLWVAMVKTGVHGTLCGAIVALTIPVATDGAKNISFQTLENLLRPMVFYLLLPFFIFINSGIDLEKFTIETIYSNISLGVIGGLFIGNQIGILVFSYYVVKNKWCGLPQNTNWLKFHSIAILAGVGFTLSLFIGDITFETGPHHYEMRSAVIIGSLLSAFFGTSLLYYSARRSSLS
jgi:NhaA family Na+:H+ antiporter